MAIKGEGPERKYSARQVALGTALEAGATVKEGAEAAGMSERWAYDILQKEKREIDEIRALVGPLVKHNVRELRQVALDKATAEFEARLGKAFAGLDTLLESGDLIAIREGMREVFDRSLGKPKSTVEVSGGLRNSVTYAIDPATLAALSSVAAISSPLYDKARQLGPVIDVEST